MQLVKEAGFPLGVVNMTPGGVESGEALVADPKVQKISFTGGRHRAQDSCSLCSLDEADAHGAWGQVGQSGFPRRRS
jgi:acyl-CoA reductase-like NAD-dependent aldehyde dehydrogenase